MWNRKTSCQKLIWIILCIYRSLICNKSKSHTDAGTFVFIIVIISLALRCKTLPWYRCTDSNRREGVLHAGPWLTTGSDAGFDEYKRRSVWCWEKRSVYRRTKEMKVSECIIQGPGWGMFKNIFKRAAGSLWIYAKYWSGLKRLEKLILTKLFKQTENKP